MRVSDHYQLGRSQATLDFVDVDIEEDTALFISPKAIEFLPSEWGERCAIRAIRIRSQCVLYCSYVTIYDHPFSLCPAYLRLPRLSSSRLSALDRVPYGECAIEI